MAEKSWLHFTSLHFITGTVWLASPNKWKEPLVLEGHSVILYLNQHSVRETYKNGDKTVGDRVLRDNFCKSNWRSDCRCRYVWMTERPECRIGPIFFLLEPALPTCKVSRWTIDTKIVNFCFFFSLLELKKSVSQLDSQLKSTSKNNLLQYLVVWRSLQSNQGAHLGYLYMAWRS